MVVIAFCGLPGSGKSTLARMLEYETGWRRLDRDQLRREQFGGHGYTVASKAWLNQRMLADTRACLADRKSVLVDGMTFASHRQRVAFRQLAVDAGARWLLVWLDCPIDLARRRVEADQDHPAADRNRRLVDQVASRFESPLDGLRLDAKEPLESALAAVIKAMEVNESGGTP